MKPGISFDIVCKACEEDSWLPKWPNPADFRFNYFKLLDNAPNGIGRLPNNVAKTVAIVGAGAAGMAAARELFRCGFRVTIFEASHRIGGRLYTCDNPNDLRQEGMEMGAMRMPFFSHPGDENCLLEYYIVSEASKKGNGAILSEFPNPGRAKGNTGIYINRGYGPENNFPKPQLISWPYCKDIENEVLKSLSDKVKDFINDFTGIAQKLYIQNNDDWCNLWKKITEFYDGMTFNDLVLEPKREPNQETGDMGGLGMTPEESELLYTIGIGDGSWGAFYNISALWFMRCSLFGFTSYLKTVEGLMNPEKLPHFGSQELCDSTGCPLPPPYYQGIQALVEYLFYVPPPGQDKSLYESCNIHINSPVKRIIKTENGVSVEALISGDCVRHDYDFVFVTSTTWASQMSFDFEGFLERDVPQKQITASNTLHNISSCKLFFPLKERFWEKPDNQIPQVIITDTYVQDIYSLAWESRPDSPGIILASYTWEDDSLKLLPYDINQLSCLVCKKLAEITLQTVKQDITQYIDHTKPVHIQWINELGYHGCSKLYRAHTQSYNHLQLAYNEVYSGISKLYFAGENYGVEGGWTEPALRSALDAVMRLLHHENAEFLVKEGFDYTCYPSWLLKEVPTYTFPNK
ncbi:MAG: FAD-dependent oxidoreductase [Calothrix sp. MO_167.B12]|nr:FAD-dependent oxidoreductase [Calothrix sp. MO_167.B12]